MRGWLGMLLILTACHAVPAGAHASDTEPAGDAQEGSWLDRTMKRYFGDENPTGEALSGRSVDIVDDYAAYAGMPIEVVLVSQVAKFDEEWSKGHDTGTAILTSVTSPFQTHTRDRTIRQYILFRSGEPLDPFRVADTERLLRGLDFIEDVRITLVRLAGEIDSVAVVVETRDRWPFGAAGNVKGVGWFDLNLYSSNIAGHGIRFENHFLVRRDFDPEVGYRGVLRKGNLGGKFVTGLLEYEDSYRRLLRVFQFDRDAVHPDIKAVGGVSWRRTRERDIGPIADEREAGDYWGGWVIRLHEREPAGATTRPILVPAVRYIRTTFLDRPTVGRDSLRGYHNRQDYLAGLTYQKLEYFRTSFLFGMGEMENLSSGQTTKISAGYQDGEFNDRAVAYLENAILWARESGAVMSLRANFGGYFRSSAFEDGTLVLAGGYITPLMLRGSWRYRFFGRLSYHRAFNAIGSRSLQLGDDRGLRGMSNDRVFGNQRLLGSLEHRAFTPWSLFGFRFMLQGFVDAGTLVGENDPLLQGKFYVSAGIGLRVRNPELVFPALQLRVALVNTIDDKGVRVGIDLGNASEQDIRVPSTRPGGFEFR